MSILNFDQMSDRQLIAQYILEFRNRGLFLPYSDYRIIESWLQHAKSDTLLLILSDILPDFFEKSQKDAQPPTIQRLNRLVLKNIKEHSLRTLSDQTKL